MSEVDQLEAEAEATRHRIASALGNLSERLDPSRLLSDARESVVGSARERGLAYIHDASRFARDNPLVLAGVGAALSAALLSRTHEKHGRVAARPGRRTVDGPSRVARGWSNVRTTAVHSRERVKHGARTATAAVGPRLSAASEAVRTGWATIVDAARSGVHEAEARITPRIEKAGEALSSAQDWTVETAREGRVQGAELIDENPAAVVIAGLAVGMAAGALTRDVDDDDVHRRAF